MTARLAFYLMEMQGEANWFKMRQVWERLNTPFDVSQIHRELDQDSRFFNDHGQAGWSIKWGSPNSLERGRGNG
jgi:hypothetical protein